MPNRSLNLLFIVGALVGCHPPLEPTFVFSGDAPSRTGLLALEEGLLFGNEAGAVTLVSWDGRRLWQTLFGREIAARPVLCANTLVVASVGGEWAGLSPTDGKQRWRIIGQPITLTPLSSDLTRVFAVTGTGSVRALDPVAGAPLWNRPGPFPAGERHAFPAPIVAEGNLFVALGEAGLLSIGALDGALNWKDAHVHVVGMTLAEGRLYVTTREGQLRALRPEDGSIIWSVSLGAPPTNGPSFLKGWLWVARLDNELIAFDPKAGSIAWRSSLPARTEAPLVELRDAVLVPTAGAEGALVGFLQVKHSVAFKTRLDNPLRSGPVVREDRAYVLASDGRLFGFRLNALVR